MNAVSKALVSAPESPEYAAWSIEHALNHTLRLRIATVGCPAARGDNVLVDLSFVLRCLF